MRTALLVLSLVANVALAAVFLVGKSSVVRESGPAAVTPVSQGQTSLASTADAAELAASGLSAEDAAALAKLWRTENPADWPAFVARLRAQGFPPTMVRAIVRALVSERLLPEWKALAGSDREVPFWKNPSYFSDPKRMATMRDLNRKQTDLVKELLGPDADAGALEDYVVAQQQRRFGNLSPEKTRKAQTVLNDYNELRSDVYTAAQVGGGMALLPEDREKLAYLQKQEREDLAKIMTPDELLNYDLRTSSTANQLRMQLMGFNPSEEEFRALFKLNRDLDEKLGLQSGVTNVEQFRLRQAATKELQGQIETVLTPERAAAYKQATDPQYNQVNRLVARLELPPAAAVEVVSVQRDIQQRANALRTNTALSAEERATQLGALVQEAHGKISTALGGSRGLEAYKQYGGGWIQNLQRPAGRAPAGP